MYTDYFGLREKPFNVTPDPRFLYTNPVYQEAYASLLYGIRERKGFIVLTGEVGTGKTTLLRRLMSSLEETVQFVFFYNTTLTFDELLSFACEDLGLPIEGKGRLQKTQALNDFLLTRLREGGTTALLIDEAQNLGDEVLENLRLLSNIETSSEKLLQIALVGQPELETKLAQPKLRQLKQRVAIQCRLSSLKEREVGPFIYHRLHLAGCERQDLFTAEALQRVALYAKGIPRLINIICDNALLIAYGTSQKTISAGIIEEVAHDLQIKAGSGVAGVAARTWTTAPSVLLAEMRLREEAGVARSDAPVSAVGAKNSENSPVAVEHWPIQGAPKKSLMRAGGGTLLALLLLGGAGAAIYPQQRSSLHTWLAALTSRETELDKVKEPPQSGPSVEPELPLQGQGSARPTGQSVALAGQEDPTPSVNPRVGDDSTEEGISSNTKGKGRSIVVQQGTTVSAIILEAYAGSSNPLIVDLIKEFNPHIENLNHILAGEKIWLPPLTRETLLRNEPDGSYRLVLASFRSTSEAEKLVQAVRRKGYKVVTLPRMVADNFLLYRVEIDGLKSMEAVNQAWELVNVRMTS